MCETHDIHYACSIGFNLFVVLHHLCSGACPMFYAFCVTLTRMSLVKLYVLLCDIDLHVRLSLGINVFLCDMSCLVRSCNKCEMYRTVLYKIDSKMREIFNIH
jgi:hypothetical protein